MPNATELRLLALQAVPGSIPDAVVTVNLDDGSVLDLNHAAEALFWPSGGHGRADGGKLLLPPARLDEIRALVRSVTGGEPIESHHTVWYFPDGKSIDVSLTVTPVIDSSSRAVAAACIIRDLTQQRELERTRAVAEENVQRGFRQSPLPQAMIGLDRRLIAVNPAFCRFLDEAEPSLIGRFAPDFLHPDDRERYRTQNNAVFNGELETVQHETRLLTRRGELRHAVLSLVRLRDDAGNPRQVVAFMEDVTEKRVAESAKRAAESALRAVVTNAPVVLFSVDADGIFTLMEGDGLARLGVQPVDLVGTSAFDFLRNSSEGRSALHQALIGAPDVRHVLELKNSTWEMHFRCMRDEAGGISGAMGVGVDVTDRTEAARLGAAQESRFKVLVQRSADVAMVCDAAGIVTYVSPAVTDVFGYRPEDLVGSDYQQWLHPDDRAHLEVAFSEVLPIPGPHEATQLRVRIPDGSYRWVECSVTNLFDDPAVAGMVANVRDITDRKAAEEELQHIALHDSLTGLPNRALLLDRIQHAMDQQDRWPGLAALLFLDLDGFKAINDTLGHTAGDQLLRVVAKRIESAVRRHDTVARLGGDEFVVLCESLIDVGEAQAVADRILARLARPLTLSGHRIVPTASVGISLTPATGPVELLAAADSAMYHAKSSGRGRVEMFDSHLHEEALRRLEMTAQLREAIFSGQLRLHYQPIVSASTTEVVGLEALVRWEHPTRGLLTPDDFIPLAEESGLVVDLGSWALREACQRASLWRSDAVGGGTLYVSVNLSARHLQERDLVELVRAELDAAALPASGLLLEMTETSVMEDAEAAIGVLQAVKDIGVMLAIDDFGTGYSSLAYLKRFPVDRVKVDRSFVAGLGVDTDDSAIVESIVGLTHAMGMCSVAEGVETHAQLEALRRLGCEFAQGYLFSPPVPPDQVPAVVSRLNRDGTHRLSRREARTP